MLLLDKNTLPENTVYYVSAKILDIFKYFNDSDLDYDTLFFEINKDSASSVSNEVFTLALDFLYLVNKISVNEKGKIYVH
ncbi:hypothetical protein DQM09_08720 [Leuconostoc mesenteroides subsp. mesenteroides]|uniref:ABC-three component system middle component 6 n=1 Tax=Leuconostoc TaxID=1243 RepID=UPI000E09C4DB|nr:MULTISPECIES: ABC-three component system middle component 6 [Leuconostoc]MCT4389015.1 hypothetical protein [Leuconostoc falkenbergense]RDF90660.1 hypothetical protein DQM09_08720 [Leuconostoc mesenteroides subsp. mesenteroides]